MKLKQGQIWKTEKGYLLIVVWERLAIEYLKAESEEALKNDERPARVSKKEFCRLVKNAELIFEPKH